MKLEHNNSARVARFSLMFMAAAILNNGTPIIGMYQDLNSLLEPEDLITLIAPGLGGGYSAELTEEYNLLPDTSKSKNIRPLGFMRPKNNIETTDQAAQRERLLKEEKQKIDLGQENCTVAFSTKLAGHMQKNFNDREKGLILFGSSQGTATLINWLANQNEEQQSKVKCLILTAVLGSGNHAILHFAKQIPFANCLPLAQFWLPWAAKAAQFPAYNPGGMQALESAKNLPADLPIIIIHNINDRLTPINDARRLYCVLKESGHENTYLIEVDVKAPQEYRGNTINYEHLTVCDHSNYRNLSLRLASIYRKHNLPLPGLLANTNTIELTEHQPSIDVVKSRIFESSKIEQLKRAGIGLATLVVANILAKKLLGKSKLYSLLKLGFKSSAALTAGYAACKFSSGYTQSKLADKQPQTRKGINAIASAFAAGLTYRFLCN